MDQLTPGLRQDLADLLAYNWDDEEADYAEHPDENHIFRKMQRLRAALEDPTA